MAHMMAGGLGARNRSRSPLGVGAAGGGGSSTTEIMQIICQREEARYNKDFSQADNLRSQLSAMGVSLFDKTNTWKATDGRSGLIPMWSELQAGHTAESLAMWQEQNAAGAPDASEAQIRELVKAREQARANKDFSGADQIRDQLKSMGVEVFDKEKMWRSVSGKKGCVIGFGKNPLDVEISALVVQREKARQIGDMTTADMIRDELKAAGVEIFDKEKSWKTAEGRSGSVPSFGAIQAGMGASAAMAAPAGGAGGFGGGMGKGMGGGGGFSMGQGETPQQQLLQLALQAAANPATASSMLSMISGGGGRGGGGGSFGGLGGLGGGGKGGFAAKVPTAASAVQSAEGREALVFIKGCQGNTPSDAEIEWLVASREKVRQQKDHATADTLRTSMKQLGIEVWDKEKRWQTTDGRAGSVPSWTTLM